MFFFSITSYLKITLVYLQSTDFFSMIFVQSGIFPRDWRFIFTAVSTRRCHYIFALPRYMVWTTFVVALIGTEILLAFYTTDIVFHAFVYLSLQWYSRKSLTSHHLVLPLYHGERSDVSMICFHSLHKVSLELLTKLYVENYIETISLSNYEDSIWLINFTLFDPEKHKS